MSFQVEETAYENALMQKKKTKKDQYGWTVKSPTVVFH